jgi:ATP-binding cassette, subfamily B, bacterial
MALRDEPTVVLFRTVWKYSAGNRHKVVLYMSLFVLANCIVFLDPLIIAWFLNSIQTEGFAHPQKLIGIASLLFVTTLLFWACHGPARVLERENAFYVRANYKKHLVDGVLSLPASWHTAHHSGDTIDKINKASEGLYWFSGRTFQVIEMCVRLTSSYIALAYFNLHSIYIVAFLSVVAVIVVIQYDKRLRVQYALLNKAENSVSAKIYDTISNITTITILRIEKLLSVEIWKAMTRPVPTVKQNARLTEIKWFFVALIASSMIVLVLVSYIIQNVLLGSVVVIGTLYALYSYSSRITGLFYNFAYMYGDIVQNKVAVENVAEIEALFQEEKPVEREALSHWKEIHIRNLNFSYGEGELHLKNVSLTLHRGEKIALIGESGSGKTTFLKLARGLYDPKTVEVFVDTTRMPRGFSSIKSHIALVPQEPELFNTTIEENITMGITYPPGTLEHYTELAQFSSVVKRLPHKYASMINERGVNLSGGEKQRLALARGLLACKDQEIVLLDEPTSSIDARNELEIYDGILREFRKKTIVSTVHRLHLLHRFDTIYFFDQGKIIAAGNLETLRKTSPAFQQLWKKYHHSSRAKKK